MSGDKSVGEGLERRKAPTQRRAKTTVEKILRAANDLIEEEGFSGIGTGRIAERAGVNISSLYQYFPNRDSILLGLYEEVVSEGARKLNALAMNIHGDELKVVVPKIIKLLLAHYESHALILIRMSAEVEDIRMATRAASFESIIRSSIRMFLQQHPEYRHREQSRNIFFLQNLVVGNLRSYVNEPPSDLKRKEFIDQLSRLIVLFLNG